MRVEEEKAVPQKMDDATGLTEMSDQRVIASLRIQNIEPLGKEKY
jgi:hypothetical protein